MKTDAECKYLAQDYLHRSGYDRSHAKKMLKCYIEMGKVGAVTLRVNGPDMKSASVTIDAEMVERCKAIIRGINLLEVAAVRGKGE